MERLQVSVALWAECAARVCRLAVTSARPGAAGIVRTYELQSRLACWHGEALLACAWLGPGAEAGWLGEEWGWTWHLRGGRRMEAVLPEMCLEQLQLRASIEERAWQTDGPVVAEQCVRIAGEAAPASGLRMIGADAWGRVRLGFRVRRDLEPVRAMAGTE